MKQRTGCEGSEHVSVRTEFPLAPPRRDLVRAGGRRWFLQTGTAGLAGVSLPFVLQAQAEARRAGTTDASHKRVILFWLSGGPSQIDMWDPKPDAPSEIRGPFPTIPTRLPGVRFSEHLPLQAIIADKLTVIRSIDCRVSTHTPITLQAGNLLAAAPMMGTTAAWSCSRPISNSLEGRSLS